MMLRFMVWVGCPSNCPDRTAIPSSTKALWSGAPGLPSGLADHFNDIQLEALGELEVTLVMRGHGQ